MWNLMFWVAFLFLPSLYKFEIMSCGIEGLACDSGRVLAQHIQKWGSIHSAGKEVFKIHQDKSMKETYLRAVTLKLTQDKQKC